jgi:putative endonuclease
VSARGEVGRLGERLASDYLRARGYAVVDANWRGRGGELDLVATQNGQVVFVEVRSRSTTTGMTAAESIGPDKQRRLLRAAEEYLSRKAPNASARIDVITVFLGPGRAPEVQHIVGAVSA